MHVSVNDMTANDGNSYHDGKHHWLRIDMESNDVTNLLVALHFAATMSVGTARSNAIKMYNQVQTGMVPGETPFSTLTEINGRVEYVDTVEDKSVRYAER